MTEPLIRILASRDAADFQALRLQGLQESPAAFSSSYEEECNLGLADVGARLDAREHGAVFGAYIDARLVGLMGVRRERHRKLAHRALLWGVYVAPQGRQHGLGQALGAAALAFAREKLNARQVILGVGAANARARALYEKLGFKQFGYEPDYIFLDGEYHDEIHMIRFLVERSSDA
jgi:RimJ/RimL family protein N-acetyltransferase